MNLTYYQWVSLALNADRIRSRRNFDSAVAGRIGNGDEMPAGWIEAGTSEEEGTLWRRTELKRSLYRQ